MSRLINADNTDVTDKTLEAFKKVIGTERNLRKATTISLANGLTAYDLEAPAKNLYPVLTPLRNRIPRSTKKNAGEAAHWKEVSSIAAGGVKSMGWVKEGQRAPRMTLVTADKSVTYVTSGQETDVTFEAQSAGNGFEDVMATAGMRLLQMEMILEEYAILGGNRSVALGTPSTPVSAAANSGGAVADGSYYFRVVALTMEGFLAASLTDGVLGATTVTGLDNQTYVLNGGSSQKSAASSVATVSGGAGNAGVITATVTPVVGAVAYAWYAGLTGAEHLVAITTINSVSLAVTPSTTSQAASAITADSSKNATYAYDGLLYAAFNSTTAYVRTLATGTAGVGTSLTSNGANGVTEIETMLQDRWDNYRLSPEEIYVNAQELKTIADLTLQGTGTPLARFNFDVSAKDPKLVAGQTIGWYFNKFSLDGGQLIPIKIHPNLAPGTIFAWAQNLPAQYQAANVPNTAEVQCRRDYYQIPWPLVTRANQTGVYCESALKVLAPFALCIINNIAA